MSTIVTEEGTGGKDGDDKGLAAGGEEEAERLVLRVGGGNTKLAEPVVHGDDT